MDDANAKSRADDGGEVGVLDLALLLAENLRTLVVVPLVAGLSALGISFLFPPSYTATSQILPPQQQQSGTAMLLANQLGALASGGPGLGLKNPADIYVAMIKSRTVADVLVGRFNLRQVYKEKYDEDVRKELASRTNVIAGKDGLIVIDVDDHDPKRAAELANAYVDALRALTQTLAVSEAAQRRLFFENQLKQSKEDLTNSEIALRRSGISETVINTMPQSAVENIARLRAQITAQEVKLTALRGYMTDSNPEFKQVQQELVGLRFQLAKAEQMDGGKAMGGGAEYVAKFRDFKYRETLFDLLAKQYEVARLDEAREGAVIQVIDAAIVPERKSKPKRAFITVLTVLAGFIGTVLFIFIRQRLRNAMSEQDSPDKLLRLRRMLRIDTRSA
jgi:uncharacterized protein involved in exopolysaccharide biosynthesis